MCSGYKQKTSMFVSVIILQRSQVDYYSYEQIVLMLMVITNSEDNTNRFIMVMSYLEGQT